MYVADDIVCMMVPLSSFVLSPARTPTVGTVDWPITASSKLSIFCSSFSSVWLSCGRIFFTGIPGGANTITGLPSRVPTVDASASRLQHKTHVHKTWHPVASRAFWMEWNRRGNEWARTYGVTCWCMFVWTYYHVLSPRFYHEDVSIFSSERLVPLYKTASRGRYSDSLGADIPGIESPWERDFSPPFRQAFRPTQPRVQCVPGLCPWGKAVGAWHWLPIPIYRRS